MKRFKYNREELICILQNAISDIGDKFNSVKYDKWAKINKYPSRSYITQYFGSWNYAMEVCGHESFIRYIDKKEQKNKEAILEILTNAYSDLNGKLTRENYQKWAKQNGFIPVGTIDRIFGNWINAYILIEKIDYKKEQLKLIKEAIIEYGEKITFEEYSEFLKRNNKPNRIKSIFKKWNNAKREAGVPEKFLH